MAHSVALACRKWGSLALSDPMLGSQEEAAVRRSWAAVRLTDPMGCCDAVRTEDPCRQRETSEMEVLVEDPARSRVTCREEDGEDNPGTHHPSRLPEGRCFPVERRAPVSRDHRPQESRFVDAVLERRWTAGQSALGDRLAAMRPQEFRVRSSQILAANATEQSPYAWSPRRPALVLPPESRELLGNQVEGVLETPDHQIRAVPRALSPVLV